MEQEHINGAIESLWFNVTNFIHISDQIPSKGIFVQVYIIWLWQMVGSRFLFM